MGRGLHNVALVTTFFLSYWQMGRQLRKAETSEYRKLHLAITDPDRFDIFEGGSPRSEVDTGSL